MAAGLLIQPDTAFLGRVIASGGGDLKKCMQCGTCSVACALSPEEAPFPRRQMIEAQWGLKERVLGDPSIWLCHNCGDCTARCPRGARPGDVLGALRREAIRHFAFPAFLGKMVASPKTVVLLFLLPALVFVAIALAPKTDPTPELEFADVFPVPVLEALFFALSGLVVLLFAAGVARFVRAIRAAGAGGAILAGLVPALAEIMLHRRFGNCETNRGQRLGKLLLRYQNPGVGISQ